MLEHKIRRLIRHTLPPSDKTHKLARAIRHVRRRAYWQPLRSANGYYSQDGQDQVVVEMLGRQRGGVFLDIGAHDGVAYSNSCYLERELGWTGVCIEPHPDVFARLKASRKCICENAAVATTRGKAPFVCVSGYGEMLSGLATAGASDRVADAVRTTGAVVREIEVPCRTVADILDQHGIEHVDYVSLDIEGGEYDILSTIDVRKLGVRILTVENNYRDDRIELHLRRQGYRLERILGCDGVYKRRGH